MSSVVMPMGGLALDVNSLAAPKGAMRAADNVVADYPGIIRGRPNFTTNTNKTTTYIPTAMHIFGSTPIVVSKDGSNWRIESNVATITGNAEPVDFDARETSFAEARKSLYYCTSTGVRALRTEAGTTTDEAGLGFQHLLSPQTDWVPQAFYLTNAYYGPITAAWAAAYCFVVKRTDANGYVKRSPPSNRFYVRVSGPGAPNAAVVMLAGPNTAGTACAFPSGTLIAGDVVEIYRTEAAASQYAALPADMYLVTSYTITAADVAAGYFPPSQVELVDRLNNDELGEALYTNPQREGALNAKYPPPMAQEIALWSSCMWYGRTKTRHRLEIALVDVGDSAGPGFAYPTSDSLGFRNITGDLTIGTNTILNVPSVTGLVVGMYIHHDIYNPFSTPNINNIPAQTKITGISGAGPYTITMSANATGTTAAAVIYAGDVITVDGVDFALWSWVTGALGGSEQTPVTAAKRTFYAVGTADMATRVDVAATTLASSINDYAVLGGGTVVAQTIPGGAAGGYFSIGNTGTLVLERTTLTGGAFTVKSTKPKAFRPAIGDDSSDTITSTQEDFPNRVYFSLPDEPEAVPLLNYFDVGSQAAPIQRLVPLRDALLVFKEDGIFRVTGSYPNWTVDCIDTKARLVRPECVAVLGEDAYAWTNRGVLRVTESDASEAVSANKIESALFLTQAGIMNDDGYHGARVLTSERHQLVLLTIPTVAVESPVYYSTHVYCFAARTGQWTRWPNLYIRAGASQSNGVLWVALNNELDQCEWDVAALTDTPRGYDRTYSALSWTATAGSASMSITNAQRGEWVPKAGDWVYWTIGSVYWRRILDADNDGSGNYTITLDSAAPSDIASATTKGAVEGTPVVLEWLPSSMGTAGMSLGVWREATFQMEGEAQVKVSPTDFRVTLGVRHDGSGTIAEVTGTPDRPTVLMRPYRMGWPRNAGRRPIAAVRLSWSEIDWPWRLAAVALIGEPGSERVRQ